MCLCFFFFFSSRRRHTRCSRDWSSDVCSSDLRPGAGEQVNIARARASQARSRYEQTVLVALREVEDALVGLRTAQDRSGAQERQVIALRRALELADMRYRNGVASYLDVLDPQRGLFGAELALTQAERDQLVAAGRLYRAVGARGPAAQQ